MTKKRKILVWSIIGLLLAGIFWARFLFKGNLIAMGGFVAGLSAPEEHSQTYKENKEKFKQAKKKAKSSYLNTADDPVQTPPNAINSEAYRQAWEYINDIDKIASRLKFLQNMYDILGSSNPDAVVDAVPFVIGDIYPNLVALPKEASYAIMEAMYRRDIEWETKYWLCHALGHRNEKEASPIFRAIANDDDEVFLLRVVSLDQIRRLQDQESNEVVVGLLDNEDTRIRLKAGSTVRDTGRDDEATLEKVTEYYYNEKDSEVKDCLLGSIIVIGGEKSFPVIENILKTAPQDEKESIAIFLGNIPTQNSLNILKSMYDPANESLSNLVISSLAMLRMEEANEFLYAITENGNGIFSVMAAGYLTEQGQKDAIPYIEKALEKETGGWFRRDYQNFLDKLNQ